MIFANILIWVFLFFEEFLFYISPDQYVIQFKFAKTLNFSNQYLVVYIVSHIMILFTFNSNFAKVVTRAAFFCFFNTKIFYQ